MAILYLMCGIPGSGKSTWAKEHMDPLDKYVSRDEIRFSMVREDEEYFAKENEVFDKFVEEINTNLALGHNTFADATHINPGSRRKLLQRIKGYEKLEAVHIDTPLIVAYQRNENRKGTRAYVPKSVIHRMYYQFEQPAFSEGFSTIYRVVPQKEIQIMREEKE